MASPAPNSSRAFGAAAIVMLFTAAVVGVSALVTLSALNATEYDSHTKKDRGRDRVAAGFVAGA